LKGPEPDKKCFLCRAPINFDEDFFNNKNGDDEMGMGMEMDAPAMEA